ncbi:MAG: tetratricopeptide repeat protein, partial [Gemmatimonadota bacterium]
MPNPLHELRRRKVFRAAALYIVGAWIVLQVADLAFPGLGIPEQAIRYVWIGALIGLPLAVLFAWRYEITPQGIVRTPPSETGEAATRTLQKSDYVILGTLLLVAGGTVFQLSTRIRQTPMLASQGPVSHEILRNTVAVLPFQNVTGDPEQEFFAAGMHDALITTLSKIGALTVKAASSTNVYRNVVQPARQTGLELRTAHLVEGSVFRTGDRVQVNVRLIAAATDDNLWSESYERDISDVLTLQNEVARTIAGQIRVELTPDEESRLASARTVNPGVYETYLRGMFHLNKYTPEGLEKGLAYLHQAVEMDPGDPLAYAGLAQGYTLIGHGVHPPPDAFARAREAAVKALELDPLFPEAHAAMAEIQLYYDWDWDGAKRSFLRALQLNPNLEFAHAHYAWLSQLLGNMDIALEHMARAQQIAPVTPIFTAWLGWLYWGDGQPDKAVAEALKSLEVNSNFPWGLYVLGGAHAANGEHEEAIATYQRLLEIAPTLGRWGLAFTYAELGRSADALEMTAALAENPGHKDLVMIGLTHAILGDRDEAMTWLEAAHEAHVDWLPWIAARAGFDQFVGSALDSLLADPRY